MACYCCREENLPLGVPSAVAPPLAASPGAGLDIRCSCVVAPAVAATALSFPRAAVATDALAPRVPCPLMVQAVVLVGIVLTVPALFIPHAGHPHRIRPCSSHSTGRSICNVKFKLRPNTKTRFETKDLLVAQGMSGQAKTKSRLETKEMPNQDSETKDLAKDLVAQGKPNTKSRFETNLVAQGMRGHEIHGQIRGKGGLRGTNGRDFKRDLADAGKQPGGRWSST